MVFDVAYDIDSFGDDPKFARKGLWMQRLSQMRQNVATDLYVETCVLDTSDAPEQLVRSSSVSQSQS